MFNRRLVLWALCLTTAASVPSRAAQSPDPPYSPVPASAVLAALDLAQDDRDPACVSECAARRDKLTAEAARQLQGKEFYSKFDSNCFSYEGLPMCAALRAQCQAGCGPKATASCLASCETAFQSCCATNKTAAADRDYPLCVAKCPVVKNAARMPTATPEPRATTRDTGANAPADKKRVLADMLQSVNKLVDAIGPNINAIGLERFNDLRRSLAFAQVSVTLAEHNGRFAMVSGGEGRIWIIGAGGQQHLLDPKTAALLRKPAYSTFEDDDIRTAAKAGLEKAGLSDADMTDLFDNIGVSDMGALSSKKFSTGGFPPGDVWYFPKDGNWAKEATANKVVASVVHFSIKGTINGGGDFI